MHAIWLGGPLRPTDASKTFWRYFGKSAASNKSRAGFVLWTDIPRSDFITAASENPRATDPIYTHNIRAMAHWADKNDISIVNVHEVFNAHDPMLLHTEFSTETAKNTGPGWAAASDILRLEILNRFGGLYSDGDNEIQDLTKAFNSARAGDNGFAANIARSSKEFTNSGLLAPAHHPFTTQALNSIGVNYGLTQKALYEKNSSDFSESIWNNRQAIDAYGLVVRRNSVMLRTGPYAFRDVASKFGLKGPHEFPKLSGILSGEAFSWSEGAEYRRPPQRIRTAQETLRFAAEITHTMIRSLYNRNGDLHLTAIQDAITKHQRAGVIWKSAFEFIATRGDLRILVHGATVIRRELTSEIPDHLVTMPKNVRAMFRIQPRTEATAPVGNSDGWWRGERSVAIELFAQSVVPRDVVDNTVPRPSEFSARAGRTAMNEAGTPPPVGGREHGSWRAAPDKTTQAAGPSSTAGSDRVRIGPQARRTDPHPAPAETPDTSLATIDTSHPAPQPGNHNENHHPATTPGPSRSQPEPQPPATATAAAADRFSDAVASDPVLHDLPPAWVQQAINVYTRIRPPAILPDRPPNSPSTHSEAHTYRQHLRQIAHAGMTAA
ncbi:glycosyltransferase, partial [Streptomyces sp. NPDC054775]